MKSIAILAAAATLVTLAGCDRFGGGSVVANSGGNGAANSAASAPGQTADAGKPSAPAAPAAPAGGAVPASSSSGPVQLDRTFLLGRWTDNGDCTKAVEFRQDGSFVNADGSGGSWNIVGDQLTMSGNQAQTTMQLRPTDQNTLTVVNANGSLGRSTRC